MFVFVTGINMLSCIYNCVVYKIYTQVRSFVKVLNNSSF